MAVFSRSGLRQGDETLHLPQLCPAPVSIILVGGYGVEVGPAMGRYGSASCPETKLLCVTAGPCAPNTQWQVQLRPARAWEGLMQIPEHGHRSPRTCGAAECSGAGL